MDKNKKNFIPKRNKNGKSLDFHEVLRYELEASILAESLYYEHAFAEIATFINPINFCCGMEVDKLNKKPLFRLIWECMLEMFPRHPIDIYTVSTYCFKKFSINICKEVAELTEKYLHCNMNRRYYCLLILEKDFRKSLLNLLDSFLLQHAEPKVKLDIMQMQDFIADHSNDIFNSIKVLSEYLESNIYYEHEAEQIKDFNSNVESRILQIKEVATLQSVMRNFEGLYHFSSSKKILTNSLVDILKFCLVVNDIPEFLESEVLRLRFRLYEGF